MSSSSFMNPAGDNRIQNSTSLPITRDSEEWGSAEALLQLIFRTSNISLRSLWSISNPGLLTKFQKRCRDTFATFPTVISAEDLFGDITLNSVCEQGFVAANSATSGFVVNIGNVLLPGGYLDGGPDGIRQLGRGRRMFEMLIVKVVIGKSFAVEVSDKLLPDSSELLKNLSREFDSVLLTNDDDSMHTAIKASAVSPPSNRFTFLPPHAFLQKYIVRSGDQILPLFICRFEIDTDQEEGLGLPVCQSCEDTVSPATVWCAADNAALCVSCDEKNHSVNKITMKHIRVPINECPKPSGPCSVRSDLSADFWNESMGVAVSGETRKEHYPSTPFEPLGDAYKRSIKIAAQGDSELNILRENLINRIRIQDETTDHMNRLFKASEESVYRKTATALQRALSMTEQRTAKLLAAEQKIKEQIEFIQWSEQLITPLSKTMGPAQWLQLWLQHYRLVRKTIARQPVMENVEDGDGGDIKIDGQLSVRESR